LARRGFNLEAGSPRRMLPLTLKKSSLCPLYY
jgi:hypothetical protein